MFEIYIMCVELNIEDVVHTFKFIYQGPQSILTLLLQMRKYKYIFF